MSTAQRVITPQEFDRLSNTEGRELIDGRLVRKTMGATSSWIQRKLSTRLGNYVDENGLGQVFESECSYNCFPLRPNRVLKPDISFVAIARMPVERIPSGSIGFAPDFVIEVISPEEKVKKLNDKITDYVSAKVPLIWIVYPDRRTVQIRLADGTLRELSGDVELTGDPVLPGFRVRVADLFPPADS